MNINIRLKKLATEWKRNRKPTSFVEQMIQCPHYQEIIEISKISYANKEQVILFILMELQTDLDHWFFALTELTGENPIDEQSRGKLPAMANCWLKWGEEKGYI